MKRNRILTVIVLTAVLFTLSGCVLFGGEPANYFETENFKCIEHDDSIQIVGTTEVSSSLEELIIPSIIREKEVKSLGYSFRNNEFRFYGKAKKIFIPGKVIAIHGHDTFSSSQPIKKIFLSIRPGFKCPTDNRLGGGGRYAPANYLDNYIRRGYSMIEAANISYINNYDVEINGGYYWIDDVEIGDRIKTVPSDPEREGYQFGGWFTEAECINQWDFEAVPFAAPDNEDQQAEEEQNTEIEEQEEKPSLTLYARWIEE